MWVPLKLISSAMTSSATAVSNSTSLDQIDAEERGHESAAELGDRGDGDDHRPQVDPGHHPARTCGPTVGASTG